MARLSNQEFLDKWALKFADNTMQDIDEARLREFRQDIADSFGAVGSPNDLPGFFKAFHCLTDAELDTPSGPGMGPGRSMQSLNWATCNIYTRIYIERLVRAGQPTRYNVLLVVQYDPQATPDHFVYIDGSHAEGSRLAPVKWVPEDEASPFAANVPLLDESRAYPAGYLVRYQLSSVDYLFYSANGGAHPAPATAAGDANWTPVTHDAPAAILSTAYSLPLIQGLLRANPSAIKPGLLYRLGYGAWNGSTQAVVEVVGGASGFARLGTAVLADGTRQAVQVDVAAGTYALVGLEAPLTGYVKSGVNRGLSASDSVLSAFGVLEKQTADNSAAVSTLAAAGQPVYVRFTDGTSKGYNDLDAALGEMDLHGGAISALLNAGTLPVTVSNRGGWPAFFDGGGSTVSVAKDVTLTIRPAGLASLLWANFYLLGPGTVDLTGQLDQTTGAGKASLLQNGQCYTSLNSDANVVALVNGYYKRLTGKGKFYLLGTVQVDDYTQAPNVVDLRAGAAASGTVTSVNGIAPDTGGNVVVPERRQLELFYDYAAGQTSAPEWKVVEASGAGYYAVAQLNNVDGGQLYYFLNDQQVFPDASGRFTLALLDRFRIQATTAAGQAGYLILTQIV